MDVVKSKEKSSFKITYDAKKNDLKGRIEYTSTDEFGNKRKAIYTCEGLIEVNKAIYDYAIYQMNGNLQDLISKKLITIDAETSARYFVDTLTNRLVERRLRRSERRALEGKPYDDTPYVATHERKEEENPVDIPITPKEKEKTVSEDTKPVEETTGIEPESDTHDITESTDINEIINEIVTCNPDVDFEVLKDADGNVECLLSSVKPEELILPGDFYYIEKNGITNKHRTKSGLYVTLPVRLLEKEKEEPSKEETSSTTTKTEDVIEEETKEDKPKKKIKNLKIFNRKNLKKILIGGIVIAGITYLSIPKGNNRDNRGNDDDDYYNQDNIYVYNGDISYDPTDLEVISVEEVPVYDPYAQENHPQEVLEVAYNERNDEVYETEFVDTTTKEEYHYVPQQQNYNPEPTYSEPENNYNYFNGIGMEEQLNDIVGLCYQNIGDVYQFLSGGSLQENMIPTNLDAIVSAGDKDAVRTVNNARNYVINNAYTDQNTGLTTSDVYNFLTDYTNYVFEGGTVFDGQAIKAFDYLDSYSQYVVTAIGESMLQLYPGYEYVSPYSYYSFDDLMGKILEKHSDLAESLTNGKSY